MNVKIKREIANNIIGVDCDSSIQFDIIFYLLSTINRKKSIGTEQKIKKSLILSDLKITEEMFLDAIKTIKENSFLCIEGVKIKKYKIVNSIELNKNDLVFTLSDDVKEISGVGESKYITVFVYDVIKLRTIEQKKLLLFLCIKGYLQEIKTSVNNFKEFVLGYENSDSMNDFEFVRYINKQFDILEEITPFKCLAETIHTSINYFYLKIKVVNKSSKDFICWMEEDPEQCKESIEKFDENKKLCLEILDLKEKTMNYIKEHKKNRMSIGDITNE